MQNILIVGATSAIAEASARVWAAQGARLHLMARNPQKLAIVIADLGTRGAHVSHGSFDARDPASLTAGLDAAFAALNRIDVVLVAHGDLPDQKACEADAMRTLDAVQVNAASAVFLLTLIANRLEKQGSGVIAVIGSPAGDRGRKSNYVYGSAKAMLETFLEGLAGRLQQRSVKVLNIKPGFVDTPMTAEFKKGPLWAKPDAVARIICSRVAAGRSGTFYAPRFWWFIMLIIKHIPAPILYRLNI